MDSEQQHLCHHVTTTFFLGIIPNDVDERQWLRIYYAGAMGALKILEDIAKYDDAVGVVILERLHQECSNFFADEVAGDEKK